MSYNSQSPCFYRKSILWDFRPDHKGQHFVNNAFKYIFITENHCMYFDSYGQTSNISYTLVIVGNKIVDHSDVVGALPVGVAPTTELHHMEVCAPTT